MNYTEIFDRLWRDYIEQNPATKKVYDLFIAEGETVYNDHIAFRTFNDPRIIKIQFLEGVYEVPGCYYEFTRRYPDSDGKLYSGFIAKSANKIFESTNFYKK